MDVKREVLSLPSKSSFQREEVDPLFLVLLGGNSLNSSLAVVSDLPVTFRCWEQSFVWLKAWSYLFASVSKPVSSSPLRCLLSTLWLQGLAGWWSALPLPTAFPCLWHLPAESGLQKPPGARVCPCGERELSCSSSPSGWSFLMLVFSAHVSTSWRGYSGGGGGTKRNPEFIYRRIVCLVWHV